MTMRHKLQQGDATAVRTGRDERTRPGTHRRTLGGSWMLADQARRQLLRNPLSAAVSSALTTPLRPSNKENKGLHITRPRLMPMVHSLKLLSSLMIGLYPPLCPPAGPCARPQFHGLWHGNFSNGGATPALGASGAADGVHGDDHGDGDIFSIQPRVEDWRKGVERFGCGGSRYINDSIHISIIRYHVLRSGVARNLCTRGRSPLHLWLRLRACGKKCCRRSAVASPES